MCVCVNILKFIHMGLIHRVIRQDLAQCVNEVKRDNEIIRQITTFQLSIESMVSSHVTVLFALFFQHLLLFPSLVVLTLLCP